MILHPDNSGSLGMTLVKTLARQLEADLNVTQNKWTEFVITFPVVNPDNQP
jgi:two-component sensor histidine kinase